MDTNKCCHPKLLQGVIFGIIGFIVLLLAFKAGTFVGHRKAGFFCNWSDNYHRNFGGPRDGFMRDFRDRDFIDANGTVGQIIKINNQTLVVKSRDNIEKIIIINDKTVINRGKDKIKITDLKANDYIVTIGDPNNAGQIEAKLIRVMPSPGTLPPPGMLPPPPGGPLPPQGAPQPPSNQSNP